MRAYAKVAPRFWTGDTGSELRASGVDAWVTALYLITGPHANMLGLYYLPLPFICHETGLDSGRIEAAMTRLETIDFVSRDARRELVWIHEMARFQVGESLKPADKRVKGIASMLERLPDSPLIDAFRRRYDRAFHLTPCPAATKPVTAAPLAPPGRRSLVARNRAALARQHE